MLKAFPKIFPLGTDYIRDLFADKIEITEKVDGSMLVFGKIDGEMHYRSKGKEQYVISPDPLFGPAIDYLERIQGRIPEELAFYAEMLIRPQHNVLAYQRTPKNLLALFGVSKARGSKFLSYGVVSAWAEVLKIDVVPLLFEGKIENPEWLEELLERESFLGGTKIEGIVVKNFSKPFLLGGQPIPLMAGKLVSEEFKEVHRESWGRDNTGKGRWQTFLESFCTEARWLKAVQHLRERGELEGKPRDIGKLLEEVRRDISEEEKRNIQEFLWREFGPEVLRASTKGLPEFYKRLLERRKGE